MNDYPTSEVDAWAKALSTSDGTEVENGDARVIALASGGW